VSDILELQVHSKFKFPTKQSEKETKKSNLREIECKKIVGTIQHSMTANFKDPNTNYQ